MTAAWNDSLDIIKNYFRLYVCLFKNLTQGRITADHAVASERLSLVPFMSFSQLGRCYALLNQILAQFRHLLSLDKTPQLSAPGESPQLTGEGMSGAGGVC